MASKYVKPVTLLVGSMALGTALATQYRLSCHHHHPHQYSGGGKDSTAFSERGAPSPPSGLPASWTELSAYLLLPLEERQRKVYAAIFGSPEGEERAAGHVSDAMEGTARKKGSSLCPVAHAQSQATGNGQEDGDDGGGKPKVRSVPTDIKTRFLLYARRDPSTGEYVQRLDDFVACLLLLEPFSLSQEKRDDGVPDDIVPASGHGKVALPPTVQRRVSNFFKFVDMDASKTVNYAEFVVFFTLLSTQQRMLRTAFDIFCHGTPNGKGSSSSSNVNELEFTRLLNVLMVDPSVQIIYDGKAKDGKALLQQQQQQQQQQRDRGDQAQQRNEGKPPRPSASGEDAAFPPEYDNSAPSDYAMSLASQTRRARRARNQGQGSLGFTIPSSTVWSLFHQPPPRHELAPPGSMHNAKNLFNWRHRDQMQHLDALSAKDRKTNTLSFDVFWYRMDFLRWELRAIEFGIFDPDNDGLISLQDFRHILAHDMEGSLMRRRVRKATYGSGEGGKSGEKGKEAERIAEAHQAMQDGSQPSREGKKGRRYFNFGAVAEDASVPAAVTTEPVPKLTLNDDHAKLISWQFYQTVFDVIRESDVTLPALRLALDAEPPVLPDQLMAGAIPDEDKAESHANVKELVAQRQTGSQKEVEDAKRRQQKLVRPTALTWQQFGQVLKACDGVPQMTTEEQQLFFELFDADRSGTITPEEFSHLCDLKRSFFALYMPRFSEPRRNTIQQFVFCMQQLE